MRARFALPLLVLALTATGLTASSAHAQVVIQGQVTYGTQQQYPQQQQKYPQQQQYPQQQYVQQDANSYTSSTYVQQPVGQPQPIRYIHRSASIPALIVPGVVLLVGGYLTQAIGAPTLAAEGRGLSSDRLGHAYRPVPGPWHPEGTYDDVSSRLESGEAHFSWVTGVVQAVGLVLLVVGLTVREEWDEPVYALSDAPDAPRLAFDVTPLQGGGYASLTLQHF